MAQEGKGGRDGISKVAIYPGSFDPITYGHIDIVERSLEILDRVIVAIAYDTSKNALFTVKERMDMVKAVFSHVPNVIVDRFKGLLVDYVGSTNAKVIVRGL